MDVRNDLKRLLKVDLVEVASRNIRSGRLKPSMDKQLSATDPTSVPKPIDLIESVPKIKKSIKTLKNQNSQKSQKIEEKNQKIKSKKLQISSFLGIILKKPIGSFYRCINRKHL